MPEIEMPNEIKLKLFGPVAESAGRTLQSVWDLVFGGFDTYVAKKKLNRAKDLEDFKQSLENRVAEIPADALKEPRLSILGPTLEASKFYFEEGTLREMFAALAAAAFDKRKERDMHPSYPEIIKQLSPLDATNLARFSNQLPLVEYYTASKGKEFRTTVLTNVFLSNTAEPDLELQSQSISSLARLGLITVEYDQTVLVDKFYADFFATSYFLQLSESLDKDDGQYAGVRRGRACITPLGKSFRAVCLE